MESQRPRRKVRGALKRERSVSVNERREVVYQGVRALLGKERVATIRGAKGVLLLQAPVRAAV